MPKSQNPDDPSKSTNGNSAGIHAAEGMSNIRNYEKRQMPRIMLAKEQFRLNENGRIYGVTDLSKTGMAIRLLAPDDGFIFPVGRVHDGILRLQEEKLPLKVKVRHVTRETVGLEFKDCDPALLKLINEFTDPVSLGKEIREMPPVGSGVLWFHGPTGTDLICRCDTNTKEILELAYSLLGNYIHWSKSVGLRTGVSRPSNEPHRDFGVVHVDTLLVKNDENPDPEKLNIARAVIENADFPQDFCNKLTTILTD